MGVTRKFLDWSRPALPSAVDYLIDRYTSRDDVESARLDMENVVVVLPGARAGRRLLEILVLRAEQLGLPLLPPLIETVGSLPELLYESKRPSASLLVQQLAWVHALQRMDHRRTEQFIRVPPAADDIARWLAIGRLLWRQHRELAADMLDFGDVAKAGEGAQGFDEKRRWEFLREVQLAYLRILDGLELWDRQTARLVAIKHRECRTDRDIVLVGTSDMNQAMRGMIDQVRSRVTAVVFAPERLADAFDRFGCVDPLRWQDPAVELRDEQLSVVDGPLEQASEVARLLAQEPGRWRADEITIGILADDVVPQIRRQLQQCGVDSRWVVGQAVARSLPYRLLEAVADYVAQGHFRSFAGLVRHPDVGDWLRREGIESGWLAQLDQYHEDHLPSWLGQWLGAEDRRERLEEVHRAVERLILPLRGDARKLERWCPVLLQLMLDVYDRVPIDRDREEGHYLIEAVKQVRAALAEYETAPVDLTPTCDAAQAIRLLLEQLSSVDIAPPLEEEAVELLGWLELPLDTAPRLVVTSFNDQFVPQSLNSDIFLPNALRRRLNLLDNARRYARDAYSLSLLLASRPDARFVAARRDGDGNPLAPSRLMFSSEPETTARRALRYFSVNDQRRDRVVSGAPAVARDESEFHVPRPRPLLAPPSSMSVTAFRCYLACPYRFYLQHVLGLRARNDLADELTPASFGTLVHEVLARFGRSELRDSTRPADIAKFLRAELDSCVEETYGRSPLAAIRVQATQLRGRLEAFALWQADWASLGWRIRHVEQPGDHQPVVVTVPEGEMAIRGRIDRVDHNERTDQWMIFDYKTSDAGEGPRETHFRGNRWIDLQLPLYRLLATRLDVDPSAELAYMSLPKDVRKVGHQVAGWDRSQLDSAEDEIDRVVGCVLNEEFWPPTDPPPRIMTEFASICQVGAFERRLQELQEELTS